jgi:hypothetical protein
MHCCQKSTAAKRYSGIQSWHLSQIPEEVHSIDEAEPREGETKMSFKAPQLTEEEEREVFLPAGMKCDGCQAVATQWNRTFAREEEEKTNLEINFSSQATRHIS